MQHMRADALLLSMTDLESKNPNLSWKACADVAWGQHPRATAL
jgi:hypothetical protein